MNRKLWKDLQICEDRVFIQHPVRKADKLFFFADAPHLIKLLRNHTIDKGFETSNGTRVTKELFNMLLMRDSGELKICHKISTHHLDLIGSARQRVRPAVQLFSASVAKAIEYVLPQ